VPRADPDLRVTVRPHPRGPCLVPVSGELDYHTSARLRAVPEDVPLEHGASLIIGLSRLTCCDSAGISVLIGAYHRSRAAGDALALTGTNPDIARVFASSQTSSGRRSTSTFSTAMRARCPARAGLIVPRSCPPTGGPADQATQ
jgi:anti-sigma B factor antagonist